MGRAEMSGKLDLERGNLRTLSYPTGEYDLTRGLRLGFFEDRFGDRNHEAAACNSAAPDTCWYFDSWPQSRSKAIRRASSALLVTPGKMRNRRRAKPTQ
jgi:hypothetical protein